MSGVGHLGTQEYRARVWVNRLLGDGEFAAGHGDRIGFGQLVLKHRYRILEILIGNFSDGRFNSYRVGYKLLCNESAGVAS